jgi:hypothetical protein
MAKLAVVGGRIEVVLSQKERLAALRGDVSVAADEVADVRVSAHPFGELRGIRAPGTGVPGAIALGTWRHRDGKDFVAIYRRRPAIVVDLLPGGEFHRLIVGVEDPDRVLEAIRAASAATGPASGLAVPPDPTVTDPSANATAVAATVTTTAVTADVRAAGNATAGTGLGGRAAASSMA